MFERSFFAIFFLNSPRTRLNEKIVFIIVCSLKIKVYYIILVRKPYLVHGPHFLLIDSIKLFWYEYFGHLLWSCFDWWSYWDEQYRAVKFNWKRLTKYNSTLLDTLVPMLFLPTIAWSISLKCIWRTNFEGLYCFCITACKYILSDL